MWYKDALVISSSSLMGEPLGSSWHLRHHPTCNMLKYGKTLWLDYRCKVRLLSYAPHLIIANKVVPFDSKQCSQALLIKSNAITLVMIIIIIIVYCKTLTNRNDKHMVKQFVTQDSTQWDFTCKLHHACPLHRSIFAQHSHAYRKIGRLQALYNFSFVGTEMHDFQKWMSRLCITARVIPLWRMMSGVLCVDEWMTEPRNTNSTIVNEGIN